MNATASAARHTLFRDRTAAIANSLVLTWTLGGWLASFYLMGAHSALVDALGVVLCVHTMVLAAYLIHEAAHQTLFAVKGANFASGEIMNFVAGSSYASFERIRHLHIRHHMDRADVACFDFKAFMQRHPVVRRLLELLEWAYVPATEVLMHLQVAVRPLFVKSQRRYLPRVVAMTVLRGSLLTLLGLWSVKALVLYFIAFALFLHVLNFFDAFHHTFDQYFIEADQPLPVAIRDRHYEQANTYSNLISRRHAGLNLLTLNFGYHNAHHHRASVPWYRLPALHRDLYCEETKAVLPMSELVRTWHRNRVSRVSSDDYGGVAEVTAVDEQGRPGLARHGLARPGLTRPGRADGFIGAHGVSFLTVI